MRRLRRVVSENGRLLRPIALPLLEEVADFIEVERRVRLVVLRALRLARDRRLERIRHRALRQIAVAHLVDVLRRIAAFRQDDNRAIVLESASWTVRNTSTPPPRTTSTIGQLWENLVSAPKPPSSPANVGAAPELNALPRARAGLRRADQVLDDAAELVRLAHLRLRGAAVNEQEVARARLQRAVRRRRRRVRQHAVVVSGGARVGRRALCEGADLLIGGAIELVFRRRLDVRPRRDADARDLRRLSQRAADQPRRALWRCRR